MSMLELFVPEMDIKTIIILGVFSVLGIFLFFYLKGVF